MLFLICVEPRNSLAVFIANRVLFNPTLAKEYAHPSVPELFRDGFESRLKEFTLKTVVRLVAFLDAAKARGIAPTDPCLFNEAAPIKESREFFNLFSRELLQGEGDFNKHLAQFGICVSHKQTRLDEYNYAVLDLGTDLRDGLRLTKLAALLTSNNELVGQMRVPAGSRLQKMHNVGVALKAFKAAQCPVLASTAKAIVAGNLEQTLALLWRVMMHFQVQDLIDTERLKKEIAGLKAKPSYNHHALLNARRVSGGEMYINSPQLSILLQWVQAVCTCYGVEVSNFGVSFSDGRALCLLVHHYHPELLALEQIQMLTTTSASHDLTRRSDSNVTVLRNDEGYVVAR